MFAIPIEIGKWYLLAITTTLFLAAREQLKPYDAVAESNQKLSQLNKQHQH
jgi:hypothetical protein